MPVVLAYRSLAVNELVVSSKTAKALQLQQAAANVKEPAPESTSLASTGKGAATAVTLAETAAETAKTARVASLSQMPPFAAESLTATLKPARRRHPLLIDDGKEHDAKRAKPLPATKLASSSPSPFNTHPRNPTIHFIFGYGSLINPESRLRSLSKSHSPAPAVVVHGLLRSWSYNCRDTYTAVGVTPVPRSAGALTTGVVLRLENPSVDLPSLDAREECYDRVALDPQDIQLFEEDSSHVAVGKRARRRNWEMPPNAVVWVYQNKSIPAIEAIAGSSPNSPSYPWQLSPSSTSTTCTVTSISSSSTLSVETCEPAPYSLTPPATPAIDAFAHAVHEHGHVPTTTCPIPQTYVDCVLTGCLRHYGAAFAREFLTTTRGWAAGPWVDDREAAPEVRRYVPRGDVGESGPSAEEVRAIDAMLEKAVAAFAGRVPLS